jgi:DNA-binding NarL/FixJ family response regulator
VVGGVCTLEGRRARGRSEESAAAQRRLTRAELEIARMLRGGLSNAEIAAARGRSLRTIANQVAAILRKLGVSSRHEVMIDRA